MADGPAFAHGSAGGCQTNMMLEALVIAGLGQLALVLAALCVPRLLKWKQALAPQRTLTRQVVWAHAITVWGMQLFFGLLSTLAPHWLLEPTPLAAAIAGFLALFWAFRLTIQFTWLDQEDDAPEGVLFRGAELLLAVVLGYLVIVYATAAVLNVWGVLAP